MGKRFLDTLAFGIYRLLAAGLCLLPITAVFRLGEFIGRLIPLALPKLRRLAETNLGRAWEGEKTEEEIQALTDDHFRLLGANLLSSIKLGTMSPEAVMDRVEAKISEEAYALREQPNRGWIAMISHIGNWEIFSRLNLLTPGYPTGAIYRPIPNAAFDAHIRESRARYGVQLFDRFKDLTKAPRFLRKGGALGILMDQYAGDLGLWVPLFGRLASTTNLPASLAIRTDVPIVPISIQTTGIGTWKVVAFPPVEPAGRTAEDLTVELNQILEKQIRLSPADWLWCHNRWKTPRPFLLRENKRGIFLGPERSADQLRPFRILIDSPRSLEEARQSLPAVETIREARPDLHLTILSAKGLNGFWRTAAPEALLLIADEERDAYAQLEMHLGTIHPQKIDAAFLFGALAQAGKPLRKKLAISRTVTASPETKEGTNPYLEAVRDAGGFES